MQKLLDSLMMMKPAPVDGNGSVFGALTADIIDSEVTRAAMEDAITRLKAKKGPDREGNIAWAIAKLCGLYEDLTGLNATHSSKDTDLSYTQEPQSPAGRFATACFDLIDQEVGPSSISLGMRLYVESDENRGR